VPTAPHAPRWAQLLRLAGCRCHRMPRCDGVRARFGLSPAARRPPV